MGTYMVHVLLHVSGLILHGSFSNQFKQGLGDYYGCFMLIRRGTGSFKCNFQIFEQLPWFWTWWNMDIHYHVEATFACSSLISWSFFKIFLLKKGLISSSRMPPHLACYLIRMLRNYRGKIWLELDSPYWPTQSFMFARMQMRLWRHFRLRVSQAARTNSNISNISTWISQHF